MTWTLPCSKGVGVRYRSSSRRAASRSDLSRLRQSTRAPQASRTLRVRRTLEIASVTAGSENDKAKNSLDDNELSEWISDGKKENAWITYEFAKPETIDQAVLKLVGWRTQSYPIKITVDGKVVYTGTTARSLGYVTIGFPPTVGRTIRIELSGEASNRDAFGNIIEISGTPTVPMGVGGEPLGMLPTSPDGPAVVTVLPGALKVLT